ncbi:hypothetical protein [Neobacillus kokaensis]|uniref:Membrane protein YwmF n=1 Tax=Neobacillus kokaensis TaxID=2759023 RepID=A0ABQ3N9K3_9BACI|nr:hypothetical protein [Neobacillus kokaensis]GHI00967.1 putative membrane protein YwmF [Neobacillus kokaensis]
MFGFADIIKFLISFFVILPIVTLIHLSGHIFFVTLFGGLEKKIVIGCGTKVFSFWNIEIRKYYFWNGACEFKSLRHDNRFTNTLIYLGGSLFNLTSIFLVNALISQGILDTSVFWYQFVYFSFYILFLSLFPMYFSDGSPSDGKAAVLTLKNQHEKKISDDIQFMKMEEQNKTKERSRDRFSGD